MKNLEKKINANTVGATSSRPHFGGITKGEKGITLIALIITIIVMLILVGVTINVALNGGLFVTAKKAVSDTQYELDREQLLAVVVSAIKSNGEVDFDRLDNNLPDTFSGNNGTYTSEKGNAFTVDEYGNITDAGENVGGTTLISMYKAGESCTEENCTNEEHLHIGDYVNYEPTTVTTAYKPDGDTIGSITGNTKTEQSISQEESLEWRVLGSDGQRVLLISDKPTEGNLHLYKVTGYNNYETILNTACQTLYSKNGIGTARSITMNDIETYLDGDNFVKENYNGGSTQPGGYEYNNPNVSSIFKPDSSGNLEKMSENVTLNLTSNSYSYLVTNVITNPTKLELAIGPDSSNPFDYGIANRFVQVTESGATWWTVDIFEGKLKNGELFINSSGSELDWKFYLRPVIDLEPNVTNAQVSKK